MKTPIIYDYHVHYFMDKCANDEMTLANIEREAARLGFDEICVVKHYSDELPNGEDSWMFWKRIVPDQFSSYLKDIRGYQPASDLRIMAGVETEILNDSGKINIPDSVADKLDILILSVHWLPQMEVIHVSPDIFPGNISKSSPELINEWQGDVENCGTEAIIKNFISAYVKAIECNHEKSLVLGHMFDGLYPLRNYNIPVDDLSDDELNVLMEPLMVVCAEKQVLWELTSLPVKRPEILKRANSIGVRFTATADAHCLIDDSGGGLSGHFKAEEYIDSLGLVKSTII